MLLLPLTPACIIPMFVTVQKPLCHKSFRGVMDYNDLICSAIPDER